MPEGVKEAAERELDRYEKIPSASAESGVIRNYIEWLVTLPWSDAIKRSTWILIDLKKFLNRDHDGLELVKERILGIFGGSSVNEFITRTDFMS